MSRFILVSTILMLAGASRVGAFRRRCLRKCRQNPQHDQGARFSSQLPARSVLDMAVQRWLL